VGVKDDGMSESRDALGAASTGGPAGGPEQAADRKAGAAARLGGEVENAIGRRLKAMYDDVLNEPVPDRFLDLLAKLDRKEPSGGAGGDKA